METMEILPFVRYLAPVKSWRLCCPISGLHWVWPLPFTEPDDCIKRTPTTFDNRKTPPIERAIPNILLGENEVLFITFGGRIPNNFETRIQLLLNAQIRPSFLHFKCFPSANRLLGRRNVCRWDVQKTSVLMEMHCFNAQAAISTNSICCLQTGVMLILGRTSPFRLFWGRVGASRRPISTSLYKQTSNFIPAVQTGLAEPLALISHWPWQTLGQI